MGLCCQELSGQGEGCELLRGCELLMGRVHRLMPMVRPDDRGCYRVTDVGGGGGGVCDCMRVANNLSFSPMWRRICQTTDSVGKVEI